MKNIFHGLGIALVTPFKQNGEIDYDALKRLIEYQIENGADFFAILATTGECPCLSTEEKNELTETIISVVDGRVPILKYCGGNNTAAVVEEIKQTNWKGIDGILSICPYYNKPSQEGLYQHFKAIAEATTLPIMIYNVPGRVGTGILPATVARLHKEYPHICAIKEASGNVLIASEIKRLMPDDDFMVYSGDDGLTLPMLSVGACGVVSVVSHVAGKDMNAMIQAYESGHNHEALRIHQSLADIIKAMFITTNPIPVKYAVRKIGLPAGVFNLPMCDPSAEEAAYIDKALTEYIK